MTEHWCYEAGHYNFLVKKVGSIVIIGECCRGQSRDTKYASRQVKLMSLAFYDYIIYCKLDDGKSIRSCLLSSAVVTCRDLRSVFAALCRQITKQVSPFHVILFLYGINVHCREIYQTQVQSSCPLMTQTYIFEQK